MRFISIRVTASRKRDLRNMKWISNAKPLPHAIGLAMATMRLAMARAPFALQNRRRPMLADSRNQSSNLTFNDRPAKNAVSVHGEFKGRSVERLLLKLPTRSATVHSLQPLQAIESRDNHHAIALAHDTGVVANGLSMMPIWSSYTQI
jgi:hypothetical protein